MSKRRKRNKQSQDQDNAALQETSVASINGQATAHKDTQNSISEQARDGDRYSYAMTLFVITLVALFGGAVDFYLHQRQVSNAQGNNSVVINQ